MHSWNQSVAIKNRQLVLYMIVPLQEHIPSQTNYMLSSLINYTHFKNNQSCLSFRATDLYDTLHATPPTLFHVSQHFMLRLGCYGQLFNLPIWGVVASLVLTIQPPALPLKRVSAVELVGICRYCIVRADYFNQAHTVCSSVKQMLFNPHLHNCQSADSCGSHNLFPTVTSVATLLFTNYVSQHALIMPRSISQKATLQGE